MANVKFTRPQHIARLFYSYWDGAAWSTHEEITDTFLNDSTKTHVGTVSGLTSFADDLVEKDRFIIYYGSYVNDIWVAGSGTIDCIAMAGLTQVSGLTLKTYGDDSIALGSVPTTLLDTHTQSADTNPLDDKNELITFTEAAKNCFMVERTGISSQDIGAGGEFLVNGGFITNDLSGWTTAGTVSVQDSTVTLSGLIYQYSALIDTGTGNTMEQNFTFGSTDATLRLDLFMGSSAGDIEVNGASTSYLSEKIDPFGSSSYSFDVPSSETTLEVKFVGGIGGETEVINVSLSATVGEAYKSSPLDTSAIVFGGDAVQPSQNFDNNPTQDDSIKFQASNSGSRSFLTKSNDIRVEALEFSGITPAEKNTLEHLGKTLSNGLCIYQRDGSSTDSEDWFIGRYQAGAAKATNIDQNKIGVTVTELVARG